MQGLESRDTTTMPVYLQHGRYTAVLHARDSYNTCCSGVFRRGSSNQRHRARGVKVIRVGLRSTAPRKNRSTRTSARDCEC